MISMGRDSLLGQRFVECQREQCGRYEGVLAVDWAKIPDLFDSKVKENNARPQRLINFPPCGYTHLREEDES